MWEDIHTKGDQSIDLLRKGIAQATLRDIADGLNLYGDRAIEDDQVIISYKKLWKLLIDKDLKRREFAEKAGISDYTLVQMNKGKKIQPVIIERICSTLGCTPNEIMEFETIE